MLSLDTNILFAGLAPLAVKHIQASSFLKEIESRDNVIISELVLLEFYVLIRNPAVLANPCTPAEAVEKCMALRNHPRWQIIGLPQDSRSFHDDLWPLLAAPNFARKRAYECRLGLSLLRQGVTEFATVNLKDFQNLGFKRVWNPLA